MLQHVSLGCLLVLATPKIYNNMKSEITIILPSRMLNGFPRSTVVAGYRTKVTVVLPCRPITAEV